MIKSKITKVLFKRHTVFHIRKPCFVILGLRDYPIIGRILKCAILGQSRGFKADMISKHCVGWRCWWKETEAFGSMEVTHQ